MISIHPDPLHFRQPEPLQKMHVMWTSAPGSTKGKNVGMKRAFVPGPKSSARNTSTVPFRSAIEIPRSTTSASTWWKTGECVASTSSLR